MHRYQDAQADRATWRVLNLLILWVELDHNPQLWLYLLDSTALSAGGMTPTIPGQLLQTL